MVGARRRARAQHRHALAALGRGDAAAGRAANAARRARCARPRRRRRDALPDRDRAADPRRGGRRRRARERGRGRDARRRRGGDPRRRVDRRGRRAGRARARGGRERSASSPRSPARSTTSRTGPDVAVANGDPLLATITGSGCMSTAITGCFLAVRPTRRSTRGRGARRVRRRRRGRGARGEGARAPSTPRLYDALAALDPATLDERAKLDVMLHALVEDARDRARRRRGRRHGRPAAARGRVDARGGRARRPCELRALAGVTFVVNDDVEAALELGADGVHSAARDEGAERARAAGLLLGLSAPTLDEAVAAEASADYLGVGPVWATPTKPDGPAMGLDGLVEICRGHVPVIAIGGIDASNAAECIRRVPQESPWCERPPTPRAGGDRCGCLSSVSSGCWPSSSAAGWSTDRARRRAARWRARRHAGRARRRRPLPPRLALLARARLPRRGGQPQRPRRLGRRPEALVVTSALPAETDGRGRARALRGHRPRRACPFVGGDTTQRGTVLYRRPQSAGPSASPVAQALGRAITWSSPARSALPGPPFARGATCGRRSESRRVCVSPRLQTRCSTSPTASLSTPASSPHAPAVELLIDLERVPLAPERTHEDLGFGEDYELLAATPDPLGFAVIGVASRARGSKSASRESP